MKAKELKIGIVLGLILLLGLADFSEATTIEDDWWNDREIPGSPISILLSGIDNVYITPSEPMFTDPITIHSSGGASRGPVSITNTDFTIDGSCLELDIHLYLGPFISYWSHSEDIGILPIGTYDLTVRTYESLNLTDTYPTTFEVIPEPVSMVFLMSGVSFLIKKGVKS